MRVCFVLLLLLNLSLGLEESARVSGKINRKSFTLWIFNRNWFLKDCTDVSRAEEPLLVLSTLSGSLIAIDPLDGSTRWITEDEPSVKANTNINDYFSSVYLPDPVSGSLYKLQTDGESGNELKKLPYTIPELVNRSPCKSSDGILYSGKKSDSWFLIDPKTGNREFVMGKYRFPRLLLERSNNPPI